MDSGSDDRPPPLEEPHDRGLTISGDGAYWWDGDEWRLAATEAPPNAKRSAGGFYWWDGDTWRLVPVAAAEAGGAVTPVQLPATRHLHKGWYLGIGAALVVAVGVCAVVAFNARDFLSPESSASAYIEASAKGDASTAWSHVSVGADPNVPGTGTASAVRLLDENSFKAALSNGHRGSVSNLTFSNQGGGANFEDVEARLSVSGTQEALSLHLIQSGKLLALFNEWKVELSPQYVGITAPKGRGSLSVDGQVLPANTTVALVFPGEHQVSMAGSDLLAPGSTSVSVESSAPAAVTLPAKLVASLLPAARKAVSDALARCAQADLPNPANCPQSFSGSSTAQMVTWKAIGDQTAEFDAGIDDSGSITATGHYQLTGSTSATSDAFGVSAGFYAVPLSWDGHVFSVGAFSTPQGSPTLPRSPSATDKLALSAAHDVLSKCAAIQQGSSASCPQSAYDATTAGVCGLKPPVTWTLPVDPTATAQVGYDPATGVYKVSGSYDYHYDYEGGGQASFCPASGHQSGDETGTFVTQLLWDGQAFVVGVPD